MILIEFAEEIFVEDFVFISATGSLELVVLNDKNIGVSGNLRDLHYLVHAITEVDIAKNHLQDWEDVSEILI